MFLWGCCDVDASKLLMQCIGKASLLIFTV